MSQDRAHEAAPQGALRVEKRVGFKWLSVEIGVVRERIHQLKELAEGIMEYTLNKVI